MPFIFRDQIYDFQLIHQLEERKHEAVSCEQFENARKLKHAIDELTVAGQTIGAIDAQKQSNADNQKYAEAKDKKEECEKFRENVYKDLRISELLTLPLPQAKPKSPGTGSLPPATRLKSQRRASVSSIGNGRQEEPDEQPQVERSARREQPRRPLPPPIEKKGMNPVPAVHIKRARPSSDDEAY